MNIHDTNALLYNTPNVIWMMQRLIYLDKFVRIVEQRMKRLMFAVFCAWPVWGHPTTQPSIFNTLKYWFEEAQEQKGKNDSNFLDVIFFTGPWLESIVVYFECGLCQVIDPTTEIKHTNCFLVIWFAIQYPGYICHQETPSLHSVQQTHRHEDIFFLVL